ncbi:MAG: rhomboid family intramembrane serine protease [Anaerolineae bacterium]|nr:rhomboid family intramembrane serine protease [Anaerolineae bacterium]
MLPIQDINPTRRFSIVNYALIAVNVIVFVTQLGLSEQQLNQVYLTQSVVPALASHALFAPNTLLDILRSMFFHAGWAHLGGNMLYLWIFGDNIEDRLGSLLYLAFYLVCGFAAGYAQVLIDPTSQIPLVGASGAIAGVLGGYLVFFPGVKVRALIIFGYFARLTEISALIVLGFWFVLQLFNGVMSLGPSTDQGGTAFFAHIGGFVIGAALIFVFKSIFPQPPAGDLNNMLYQRQGRPY